MKLHPPLGKAWTPAGDDRASRMRVPLAWVSGAHGGLLYYLAGSAPDASGVWTTILQWDAWVKATGAVLVPDPPPDDPGALVDAGFQY